MLPYILNLFDLVCTYYFINQGGSELNPVVRWMMATNPLLYPFCKIVLMGLMLYYVVEAAKVDIVGRVGYWIITIFYGILATYYSILIILLALL